jgi:hypothetical protein
MLREINAKPAPEDDEPEPHRSLPARAAQTHPGEPCRGESDERYRVPERGENEAHARTTSEPRDAGSSRSGPRRSPAGLGVSSSRGCVAR